MATRGNVDQCLNFMTMIIVSMASEMFGFIETRLHEKTWIWTGERAQDKRREREHKIRDVGREMRTHRKQFKSASTEERLVVAELRGILRNKLKNLRRAEGHRRRRKERPNKRASFISNPFGFTRSLVEDKMCGILETSKQKIYIYLWNTFSDPGKDQELDPNDLLITQERPKHALKKWDSKLERNSKVSQCIEICIVNGP